jgi:hypothetical protein
MPASLASSLLCVYGRIVIAYDLPSGDITMSITKLLITFTLGALFFVLPENAEAAQRTVVTADGRAHVVHDSIAPVIMHRLLPPYKGIHIHRSELHRQGGRR